MLYCIAAVFETIFIYAAFMFFAEYLFLEPCLDRKISVKFHTVSVALNIIVTAISYFYLSIIGEAFLILNLSVWLYLEHKPKRIRNILLVVPISGIIDGLFLPFTVLPERVMEIEGDAFVILKIAFYIVAVALMLLLQWRLDNGKKALELGSELVVDSHNRKLGGAEMAILYFIGSFEMFFSNLISLPLSDVDVFGDLMTKYEVTVILLGVSTLIMTVVVIIIVLVGNKRAFYQHKVADMQFNIIVTMAEIVENRDADTGGHIQRTAKYVDIITNHMRRGSPYSEFMTEQFLNDIRIAAPLHDIGKIHVSDTILNFPGRLSPEDFEIMKSHAAEGKKLLIHTKQHLGNFSYLDMAIDMAGSHHEWWDGSAKGYPDGLKGEEIPLCARIMAVADVFDALTARRVYKEPMPYRKAYKIILEESGTHFDPVVVDAFVGCFDKIKAALKEFEAGEVAHVGHALDQGLKKVDSITQA